MGVIPIKPLVVCIVGMVFNIIDAIFFRLFCSSVDASVVKQMLLYIYGGVLDLDPGCSIGGLVMIADMYDVIGMKSIVSLILNKDYCHFFHKVFFLGFKN